MHFNQAQLDLNLSPVKAANLLLKQERMLFTCPISNGKFQGSEEWEWAEDNLNLPPDKKLQYLNVYIINI